ncbi:hypothetical protein N9Q05_00510 [bacterium]|nr:hypothetical protein [bacterium]
MGGGQSKQGKEKTGSEKVESPPAAKTTPQDKGFNVVGLPATAKANLAEFLSLRDLQNLANAELKDELGVLVTQEPEVARHTGQGTSRFFKKKMDEAKRAYPLLLAAITGNLGANPEEENRASLMNLVRNNPSALFLKGDISFPNGCDLYLLPTLPQASDMTKYKGCYIWINNKDLIYVHYDGTKEDVHLNDVKAFKKQNQSLPKEMVDNEEVIALSNQKTKEIITDNGGHKPIRHQYFHNVSAFQLMQFFCDEDMITHIMRLVSPLSREQGILMKGQLDELGTGGADIIKVDRDPQDLQFKFEDLLHYKTSYNVDYANGAFITAEVTIPLLENPDGLVYYKSPEGTVHLYRACVATKTIEPIDLHPVEISEHIPFDEQQLLIEEKRIFDKMMSCIDAMEPMSAKRSSNDEQKVIAKTMRYADKPVQLHRQGITFELEGVRFQSNRYDFNRRINAYRTCERLYSNGRLNDGNKAWCRELGHIQKEVMWWFERDCEENRPYYPLPDFKSSPFRRTFNIDNLVTTAAVGFSGAPARFAAGLGSIFALYKARGPAALGAVRGGVAHRGGAPLGLWRRGDLVAGIRLVESAKANVVDPDFKQDMARGPTRTG